MTPMTLDNFGRLACDLTCVQCGHNLRGLQPDGVCCECGQPVDISLAGSRLAGADPQWLERVCAGTGLLTVLLPWLWLPIVWPFVVVAGWLATALNSADRRRRPPSALPRRIVLLAILIGGPAASYFVLGQIAPWRPEIHLVSPALTAALLVIWIAFLLPRLSGHVGDRRLHNTVQLLFVCWIGGFVLLLLAVAVEQRHLARGIGDLSIMLSLLGGAAGLIGLTLLPIALIRLWRELDKATTLAQSRRRAHPLTTAPASPTATSPAALDSVPPAQP